MAQGASLSWILAWQTAAARCDISCEAHDWPSRCRWCQTPRMRMSFGDLGPLLWSASCSIPTSTSSVIVFPVSVLTSLPTVSLLAAATARKSQFELGPKRRFAWLPSGSQARAPRPYSTRRLLRRSDNGTESGRVALGSQDVVASWQLEEASKSKHLEISLRQAVLQVQPLTCP